MHGQRITDGINPGEAFGGPFCQRAERGGHCAMIICWPTANCITGIAIARSEARGKRGFIAFQQDHQIRPQSAAAEIMQAQDRVIAQSACSALIGAAHIAPIRRAPAPDG